MVLKPEPLSAAIRSIRAEEAEVPVKVIYMSPQGIPFTQKLAEELSRLPRLLLVCGHYEGIDERIIEKYIDMEVSIGDYVLTNGTLPAAVVVDAVVRLLPGVLGGGEDATRDESFTENLLEYPQYTRPPEFRGMRVPEVLQGGDHKEVAAWRRKQSYRLTAKKRPDLLAGRTDGKA